MADYMKNAFDDEREAERENEPNRGLLVRPMDSGDAEFMIGLMDVPAEDQQEVRRSLVLMKKEMLVVIQPGGMLIGFGQCSRRDDLFGKGGVGVSSIVTLPGTDRVESASRLIRGFALQALADGRKTLNVAALGNDQDSIVVACTGHGGDKASGATFRIGDLSGKFGSGAKKNAGLATPSL